MSGMVNVSAAFPSATEAGGNIFQLLKLIDNQDEYKKRIEELSAAEQAAKDAAESARSQHEKAIEIIEEANRTAAAVVAAQEALAKARKDFTDTQTAVAFDLQQRQQKLDSDAAKIGEDAAAFHASYDSKSAELQQHGFSISKREQAVIARERAVEQREASVERQMARIREIAAD